MSEQNRYIYEFGPFRLDAQRRVLFKDGEPQKLYPKEFDTLLALVEHSGEVLDKDELMRQIWHETIVEEGNLTTNISHLRKLLGETRHRHEYILTIPGRGYRFVAGVRPAFDESVVHERTRAEITIEEDAGESDEEWGGEAKPVGSAETTRWSEHTHADALKLARQGSLTQTREKITVLALAALVVVALGTYIVKRVQDAKKRSLQPFSHISPTRLTNSGRAKLATISPDGKYVVYAAEDEGGQSLWLKQVATQGSVLILEPKPVEYWGLTVSPDGNYIYPVVWEGNTGAVTLYRVPMLGGPAVKLPVEPDSPISFSPNGNQFAFLDASRGTTQLMVANTDGTSTRQLASRQQPEYFDAIRNGPAWSPDGKVIVVALNKPDEAGQHEVVLAINPEDGSESTITSPRWSSVTRMKWLPDGNGLLATVNEQATMPSQVWYIPYPSGEARRLTNDLNDYEGLSLSADAGTFVTVQTSMVSNLWILPSENSADTPSGKFPFDATRAARLASEIGGIWNVAWMPDGRVVYSSRASGGSDIWVSESDGSNVRQLTTGAQVDRGVAVSRDGKQIAFGANRAGAYNVWRVGADGSAPVQLTFGNGDLKPAFSPDGRWVIFQRGAGLVAPTVWKVSVDGGEATQLTLTRAQRPQVSPDGKLIAYYYLDSDVGIDSRWSIGIAEFDGGRRVQRFDLPPMVLSRIVHWTFDGRAVTYVEDRGGVSNIWAQPLDGGAREKLTDFSSEQILAYDWSHDGRRLAVVRGAQTSDVVLFESHNR
jgi:Tol biopolymer transport system component/DNA-binding winged helix-turn-helix (wHTH) protein